MTFARLPFLAAASALVLLSALPAAATVVNFAGLSQPGAGRVDLPGATYSQDGFTFTVTGGPFGTLLSYWQDDNPNHPLGGAPATSLTSYFAGSLLTITHSGGAFNLQSIDLAQWGARGSIGNPTFAVTFDGDQTGGGTVSQTFNVPNVVGSPQLNTYDFSGFTNLTAVRVTQTIFASGDAWQFDNLTTGHGGVPEPAAWTLMILGFGLVGAAARGARVRGAGIA